ncbi:MAG: putative major facilitator superfamily transporter [Friedmanniella sp.]|nr:putative major facilitator superfamily transporter [Friedmanniella sp.]
MNRLLSVRDALRARRTLPREVYVLGLIAFCVAVGFGVLVPVLPVFARSFGVGKLEVGAVISAFALMRLVSSPFCGRLITRFSERLVMAVGIFIVAISSGLAGLAHSYVQLLTLRGIGGIGSAMFTVSATTLLLTSVDASVRGRAAGFFQGGFLLGGMTGPAIGGVLSAISLTAPFFFYAATLAVAGTVGLVLLRVRSERATEPADQPVVPFREVLRDVRYQAACFTNFAQGWTSFGVRSSLVPLLIVEVLNRPPSWTGTAFAGAAVAQTLAVGPAGRFVDTVGRRPALIGGCTLAAVSIMAVAFSPNIWFLVGALALYGVAAAFLGTAPAATVGDAAGGRGGSAVAVFSMCSDVGAIIGPLVAGLLADQLSYPVAFGVGAALMLGAAGLGVRMPRRPAPDPTKEGVLARSAE